MMRREGLIAVILMLGGLLARGQESMPKALFVPNEGQWMGDFDYRAGLRAGAFFLASSGYTCVLRNGDGHDDSHSHGLANKKGAIAGVAYQMEWINGNHPRESVEEIDALPFTHNYFLGNDPSRWKTGLSVYEGIRYSEIYKDVDVEYSSSSGHLKYNVILKPGGDISKVRMGYKGVQEISLRDKKLVLHTAIGEVVETIPETYQIIDGEKISVECGYVLQNGTVGFELGDYDPNRSVIIDPVLMFSTFTGSASNNWGFTATYDSQGGFYGGGIVFGEQFPVTPGAFQKDFKDNVDIAINKFSASGDSLEYATFVGGNAAEKPHSMIASEQGDLLVLGNTGSSDFPITPNAFQKDFQPGMPIEDNVSKYDSGSSIVVFRLNPTGTALIGSTYLGGSISDGVNTAFALNYGDHTRGEVILLENNNVAVTSSSLSTDLPLDTLGAQLADSLQKAILAVFRPDLSSLAWGTYFGGSGQEAGYSLATDGTYIFLSGATSSTDLPGDSTATAPNSFGKLDGFLAKFNAQTGQFMQTTYVGTAEDDEAFFVATDEYGMVYSYGQSQGAMPISGGTYSNPGSYQFVQKYSTNLDSLQWSTQIGSGDSKIDLVPAAFMVDECFNIYLSGWGGEVNLDEPGFSYLGGNTHNLPTTPNALQSTTDGSDFYFMVLGRNAQSLLFATYFGGTSDEHVDGGTSRFDPQGIIYQAACAECYSGDFPTTPGSYSPDKPNNLCNFGAIKIDFEQTVRSLPAVDFSVDVDTVCDQLQVHFTNNSVNVHKYNWNFGNGQTSTESEPTVTYDKLGKYEVTLIAEDTICGMADTNGLVIDHSQRIEPKASFEVQYVGCDKNHELQLTNTSKSANSFAWSFGDGSTSSEIDPAYQFSDPGAYQVRLIAADTICNFFDTAFAEITFRDTAVAPEVSVGHEECGKGELDINIAEPRNRYSYHWKYEGGEATGPTPQIRFSKRGLYTIKLEVQDTLCSKLYEEEFEVEIEKIGLDLYIPKAFTPNGDGKNEEFYFSGDNCLGENHIWIFNRWGEVIFETDRPFEEFWDGTRHGQPAPTGVYTYVLEFGSQVERGKFTLFR